MLKKAVSKAADESKPEAYHFSPAHPKLPRQLVLRMGHVGDFDELRTKLAGFFSILLEKAALLEVFLVNDGSRLSGKLSPFL